MLLAAGVILWFSPAHALAHGGGGGGHGGGFGGGGGGHFGGGSFGGGHFGGGSFGGGHVSGGWGGGGHYGGGWGGHLGGYGGYHVGSYGGHATSHVYGGSSYDHAPAYHSPAWNGGGVSTFHNPGALGSAGHWAGANAIRHEQALGANTAFRSNWNHNFDRWNSAELGHPGLGRHGEEYWEHFGRYGGLGFGPFWGFGGYPFYDFSYLPYFGYGGGGYPYAGDYDYGYPYDYGVGGYGYSAPVATYAATDDMAYEPISPADEGAVAGEEGGFLSAAMDAFRRGDYHDAIRLAEHAAVDTPRDVKVHRLMSQALFALKVYPAAAVEAHAALALGPAIDWNALQGYYGDVANYTTQLRALEKYAGDHPKAADGVFLLGYQYQMLGYQDQARQQFANALKLVPADKVASKAITDLGGRTATKVPGAPPTKIR